MPSVSGLNREQRGRARDRVVQAALLALDNKDAMDYTDPTVQARIALRWDGIQNRRNSWRKSFRFTPIVHRLRRGAFGMRSSYTSTSTTS